MTSHETKRLGAGDPGVAVDGDEKMRVGQIGV